MLPHRTIAPSLVVVATVRGVASTCSIATCVLPSLFERPDKWPFCLSTRILQHVFFNFRSISRSPMSSSACRSGSSPSSTRPNPQPLTPAPSTPQSWKSRTSGDCGPPSRCGFRCPSQPAAGGAGYESGARLQGANGCFGSGSLHFDLRGKNALESRGRGGGGLLGILIDIMSFCCCVRVLVFHARKEWGTRKFPVDSFLVPPRLVDSHQLLRICWRPDSRLGCESLWCRVQTVGA